MTDDLRTRAREAALVWQWGRHYVVERDELSDYRAFIEGFLAHAAQQPSREQIARAIYQDDIENGRVELDFACIPDDERDWYLSNADAILALFDGPVS